MIFINALIDVSFENRHKCWFCGEPNDKTFTFPHDKFIVVSCIHPTLTIPCCRECELFSYQIEVDDIWSVRQEVKKQLRRKYQKDLAIGLVWTQESLATSQFEGGNFEGFQRSAWMMFEIARDRVNYRGWPLSLNGILLENMDDKPTFHFDGLSFSSIDEAITHYCQAFDLHYAFFKEVLQLLGINKFAEAVRLCRIHIGSTPQEKSEVLQSLTAQD